MTVANKINRTLDELDGSVYDQLTLNDIRRASRMSLPTLGKLSGYNPILLSTNLIPNHCDTGILKVVDLLQAMGFELRVHRRDK